MLKVTWLLYCLYTPHDFSIEASLPLVASKVGYITDLLRLMTTPSEMGLVDPEVSDLSTGDRGRDFCRGISIVDSNQFTGII